MIPKTAMTTTTTAPALAALCSAAGGGGLGGGLRAKAFGGGTRLAADPVGLKSLSAIAAAASPPSSVAPAGVSASAATGAPVAGQWGMGGRRRNLRRAMHVTLFAVSPVHTALAPEVEETEEELKQTPTEPIPEPKAKRLEDLLPKEYRKNAKQEDGKSEDVISVKSQQADESLKLENCGLSPEVLRALEKKGITALFPIQKHVFDPVMQGRDIIGRARTGSGKTLAFAIPIVENLLKENKENRPMRGRPPRCLVMTPTRELANQVGREVATAAPGLSVGCFYGGSSLFLQKRQLSDGVDVVVGTPGRLIDLIEQRVLDLSRIRYAVLDESDQMLDMGFEEDMERILEHAPRERQTLLFSATLPFWVKKVSKKYLNNHVLVDLVGDDATGKIAESIKVLGIMIDKRYKRNILTDLLTVHGAGNRSIVFTQTKREADILAAHILSAVTCEPLHGDIAQSQRELTLQRFREGKFNVLVATDVAARGLDIPNVELIVHYDFPQDSESLLHRSGRTGRAGKSGTAILMFTRQDVREMQKILKETRTKLEMIGPPAPREVMQASTRTVLARMGKVEPEVVKFFAPAAEKLIGTGDATQVLAAALASMSGFDHVPKPRSLLTNEIGLVTLRILAKKSGRLRSRGHVIAIVRDLVGEHATNKVGRIEMMFDDESKMEGALVDLPVDFAITFLQTAAQDPDGKGGGLVFDRPKHIPMSVCMNQHEDDSRRSGGRYGGYGRQRGGGGSRYSDGDEFRDRLFRDRERRGGRFGRDRDAWGRVDRSGRDRDGGNGNYRQGSWGRGGDSRRGGDGRRY